MVTTDVECIGSFLAQLLCCVFPTAVLKLIFFEVCFVPVLLFECTTINLMRSLTFRVYMNVILNSSEVNVLAMASTALTEIRVLCSTFGLPYNQIKYLIGSCVATQ